MKRRAPDPLLAADGLRRYWNALDFSEREPHVLCSAASIALDVAGALIGSGHDLTAIRSVIDGLLEPRHVARAREAPEGVALWRRLRALR